MAKESESSGGIVLNQTGQVLVVNQNGDSWSLPKGHIDEGEDALTAAKREIKEEAGINDLKLISKLGSYQRFKIGKDGVGEDKTDLKTIHIFLFSTAQINLEPEDKREHPEARWVDKGKVANLLTHSKDKDFFLSIKNRL